MNEMPLLPMISCGNTSNLYEAIFENLSHAHNCNNISRPAISCA